MSTVRVGEVESLESAMKRFKRKCQKDGIIGDLRKKEQYEKPSVRKKKKSEASCQTTAAPLIFYFRIIFFCAF